MVPKMIQSNDLSHVQVSLDQGESAEQQQYDGETDDAASSSVNIGTEHMNAMLHFDLDAWKKCNKSKFGPSQNHMTTKTNEFLNI